VASSTPVRADTRVGLEFQGLTGVPVIALEGGMLVASAAEVPTLVADPDAGQGMTQTASNALKRVDSVLAENSGALKDTIANFKVFSEGLARNTGKLDGIVAGLERMTGATAPPTKITYDLRAPKNPAPLGKVINFQWAIPEPTAVTMLQTQRFLFVPEREVPGFAEALWADSIPRLVQARLIESFENYDVAHAPFRAADVGQSEFQLLIDVRRFRIAMDLIPTAEIGLSARILNKDGKVIASRLFEEAERCDKLDPPAAVAAFDLAFARIAKNVITWTVEAE
jgi:phospholipid/cholesterol/gamma-HCH transport system substrate-binding protein